MPSNFYIRKVARRSQKFKFSFEKDLKLEPNIDLLKFYVDEIIKFPTVHCKTEFDVKLCVLCNKEVENLIRHLQKTHNFSISMSYVFLYSQPAKFQNLVKITHDQLFSRMNCELGKKELLKLTIEQVECELENAFAVYRSISANLFNLEDQISIFYTEMSGSDATVDVLSVCDAITLLYEYQSSNEIYCNVLLDVFTNDSLRHLAINDDGISINKKCSYFCALVSVLIQMECEVVDFPKVDYYLTLVKRFVKLFTFLKKAELKRKTRRKLHDDVDMKIDDNLNEVRKNISMKTLGINRYSSQIGMASNLKCNNSNETSTIYCKKKFNETIDFDCHNFDFDDNTVIVEKSCIPVNKFYSKSCDSLRSGVIDEEEEPFICNNYTRLY